MKLGISHQITPAKIATFAHSTTMGEKTRAYLLIHTSVLLWGFTGILGDLIQLEKPLIVFWRMLLTTLSLSLIPGVYKGLRSISRKDLLRMVGIGTLVALHWATFFGAIGLTNVSVTLACLATASFMTAVIEPILMRTRHKWYELALGLAVIPGVGLVYATTGFPILGIAVALISALLATLFSIFNKTLVSRIPPLTMTYLELGSGFLVYAVMTAIGMAIFPHVRFVPVGIEWVWFSILAFLCTSFAYVISLMALKVLSTFAVNLSINMEPVYTIILAAVLLREDKKLSVGFYLGATIIILAVFFHPMISGWAERREKAGKQA